MLSSSPEKFGVAVSADALDIFELGISLLDPLPLGFVDLGFRLVFTTRGLLIGFGFGAYISRASLFLAEFDGVGT